MNKLTDSLRMELALAGFSEVLTLSLVSLPCENKEKEKKSINKMNPPPLHISFHIKVPLMNTTNSGIMKKMGWQ